MIAELTFLIVAVALALPNLVVYAFEISGHPRPQELAIRPRTLPS